MARQTCLYVTAGPHGAPQGQGKHGSETKQVWGLQPKGGKFSTESVQNQQMGCASWWRREREFKSVTQVVKLRSRAQNNTNQSATDVNSSAQTTTKEQTTLVARISLQENILTQVTLTPGFLLPKTCSQTSQVLKGESPSLVTSVFLLSVFVPRALEEAGKESGGGGGGGDFIRQVFRMPLIIRRGNWELGAMLPHDHVRCSV